MTDNLLEHEKQYFLNTYNRIPLDISHGEGVHLIDKSGKKYLDFFSGLGVNALGYNHPAINSAIREQIKRFTHLSNYFITDVQLQFAKKLLEISRMSKIFLTNSGTEAVETALKLIRKKNGSEKTIFSLTNSFHGRTYGALSLTARQKYREGFNPFLNYFGTINFDDLDDLQRKINSDAAAVFVEFIQGEGGINIPSDKFIKELFELKKRYNFLVIADEIQSGIGRTGKPFAFNYFDVEPDIILVAKSIGGGLPLGAILVNEQNDSIFEPGSHGSTFGGNPLSCAAGLALLNELFEGDLLNHVSKSGNYIIDQLVEIQNMFPDLITNVRGKGFMVGIQLSMECSRIITELREKNVLANCAGQNVLRLLPPFISTKNDIDFFLYNFHEVLKSYGK